MSEYAAFLDSKSHLGGDHGFAPTFVPDFLFPFQRDIVEWAVCKGRAAIFADCGMGKTPMQLVWAQNVVERTNRPVLVATPLAVSHQLIRESEKFGIGAVRSRDGYSGPSTIVVTNYERLHYFDPSEFAGMVCDESSILKSFSGRRRTEITQLMKKMKYRLLCTATAAPNDYIELGTSSEALGEMGYMDMLGRFFVSADKSSGQNAHQFRFKTKARTNAFVGRGSMWRFKGHAEDHFWRWVCSWARACRRPSDLGYEDDGFILPELRRRVHVVKAKLPRPGCLFNLPATNLQEEREERRRTIEERCEQAAALVDGADQAIAWCQLNAEADRLEKMIPGAKQVAGSNTDEEKEERLLAFADGDLQYLVTKPKIGAWGLNLQRCNRVLFFPSHSYEQYYQAVRRCWRFGQKRPVTVDVVATDGEVGILDNLQRKADQADRMFTALVEHMNDAVRIENRDDYTHTAEVPTWL